MPGLPLDAWNISLTDFRKDAPINTHQKIRYDLIDKLLSQIPKRGKGLDYGCGLGDQVYHFSRKFESIIGVDVTPERVEWANREFAPLQFEVCAPDSLHFDSDSFDTVLSSVVINWVDDTNQYLRNIHRVLAPGGHLVLLVKNPDVLRMRIRRLLGRSPLTNRDHLMLAAIKTTLSTMGFSILDIDHFYESVTSVLTNPKNVALELLKMPLRITGNANYSHYYGILARKVA